MSVSTDKPRIYVACLASYNAGCLHGRWIDAAQDADEIHAEIAEILKSSPEQGAEEWAIHDYEGFEGISVSEYESIETVARLAELIAEHGGAFAAFYSNDPSDDLDSLAQRFEDSYRGEWESEQDFAYQLADDLDLFGDRKDSTLETYFDWEKWTRDLFLDGYWSAPAAGFKVYVFDSYA